MTARSVRSISVSGRRWPVSFDARFKDAYAKCYDGLCGDGPRRIVFDRSVLKDELLLMETVLHEMLHAAGGPLDEGFVEGYAADAATALHRLGFKRGAKT